MRSGGSGGQTKPNVALHPNSVAVFDIKSERVVRDVSVGHGAAQITAGGGIIWVANVNENTVSLIDPNAYTALRSGSASHLRRLPSAPAEPGPPMARKVRPPRSTRIRVTTSSRSPAAKMVVASPPSRDQRRRLARSQPRGWPRPRPVDVLDPRTHKVRDRIKRVAAAQLAIGGGSLWGYGDRGSSLDQVDLRTHLVQLRKRLPPPASPEGVCTHPGITYGFGYAWAVSPEGALYRVAPNGDLRTITIPPGGSESQRAPTPSGLPMKAEPSSASTRPTQRSSTDTDSDTTPCT